MRGSSEFVSLRHLEIMFRHSSRSIRRCCEYLAIEAVRRGRLYYYPQDTASKLHAFYDKYTPEEIRRILAENTLTLKYGDAHYNNRQKCKETRLFNLQNPGHTLSAVPPPPKLMGSVLVLRRIQKEYPKASVFQIRNVLAHLGLPLKIDEAGFLKVLDFYRKHPSDEIKRVLTESTCLKKYGVKNINQLPGRRADIKKCYDAKTPEEKAAIKEKRRQTNQVLFGVDNYNSIPERKEYLKKNWKNNIEKGMATCLERYGVPFYASTEECKGRIREICNSRSSAEKAAICARRAASLLLRSPEEKAAQAEKYRGTWDNHRKGEMLILEKELGFPIESVVDLSMYLERDLATLHAFLDENNIEVFFKGVRKYIRKSDAEWVISQYQSRKAHGYSQSEKAIVSFLREHYSGPIIENARGVLSGRAELDIYLPEKNLAIEFNGCYWHSDAVSTNLYDVPSKDRQLFAKWRHFKKYKECKEKGIHLIQIFEDTFADKRDAIFSIILCHLNISVRRIFARKCTVNSVPHSVYKEFLEKYHLQGYSYADIRCGLFYAGKLVEVLGVNTKGTHSRMPELVRLCTIPYTIVVGGFTRLLAHGYSGDLVSYIDPSVFSGGGYEKAGFSVDGFNRPVYFYVRYGRHTRHPRTVFTLARIKALHERGDLSYWNPVETEAVNMYKNGYYRIWNCGTIRVVRKGGDRHVRQGADKVQS